MLQRSARGKGCSHFPARGRGGRAIDWKRKRRTTLRRDCASRGIAPMSRTLWAAASLKATSAQDFILGPSSSSYTAAGRLSSFRWLPGSMGGAIFDERRGDQPCAGEGRVSPQVGLVVTARREFFEVEGLN